MLRRSELREMFVLADDTYDVDRAKELTKEMEQHEFNVSFGYFWSLLGEVSLLTFFHCLFWLQL